MGLRLILFGIALLGATALQPVAAQTYRIAIVDLQEAANASPQKKAAERRIEKEFRKRDRELIAKQKSIRQREEKLVRDRDAMSEEQMVRANRDIRRMRREWQRELDEFNDDQRLRKAEELRKLQSVVIKVTRELAADEKFDLVLIQQVAVFVNGQKLDVTNKVIERLKRLSNGG